MKVLFDTNIILDVLLNRAPFIEHSASLLSLVERKQINGYLCATTITTLDYLITKMLNRNLAKIEIKKLLHLFNIAPVTSNVLEQAINSNFTDFEDAVQYFSATSLNITAIVTRNPKDYKKASIPIYLPKELLTLL